MVGFLKKRRIGEKEKRNEKKSVGTSPTRVFQNSHGAVVQPHY
jgi:hypothetical protein